MNASLLELLRCIRCEVRAGLRISAGAPKGGELDDGNLACNACSALFNVRDGIPRFAPDQNYARSFGFQWHQHARTQLDHARAREISESRFFETTGWARDLRGQRILEAGSGAGRFTPIVADTGATVCSFDYSNAIEANRSNTGARSNVHFLQADIYNLPFEARSFDKVVCLGVLQHCPDPGHAFRCLVELVAPGGQIAVDVYSLRLRSLFHPKYWLRPLTKRMRAESLYGLVRRAVPVLLPVKRRLIETMPFGEYLGYFVPVAYQRSWRDITSEISEDELLDLSVLDTFDWFSPAHDHPQTLWHVRRWFAHAGLHNVRVQYGVNGIVATGEAA